MPAKTNGGIIMIEKTFLDNCTACGGNWTAMLMSGIKRLFPEYWEKMPDKEYDINEVFLILKELGVFKPR